MVSDLKCLSQWANIWQLKLNVKKCGVLHIGHNNTKFNFILNKETLQKIYSMKNLGVIIDNTLHFNECIDKSIAEEYQMCYSILHGFYTNSIDFIIMLYRTYIRPLLQFNKIIWTLLYINYIDKCERIQRYFTKRLQGMQNISYLNRLKLLHLETLEERRIYNDLICAY